MKKTTRRIMQATLAADETIRHDQRVAAISILSERGAASAPTLPLLFTQAQAARLLNVSRATIFRMTRNGELHPILIRGLRRYRRADLEEIACKGTAGRRLGASA